MNQVQDAKKIIKHKNKRDEKIGLATIIIILILIATPLIYRHYHPDYSEFVSARTTGKVMNLRNRDAASNKLEYDFTYRGLCKHCESVEGTVAPLLKRNQQLDRNQIVVNNRAPLIKKYVLRNNLVEVPTVSIRYHGYLIYQYTGLSHRYLTDALKGIDPSTGRHFKRKVPQTSVLVDGFDDNQKTTEEPLDTQAKD